MNDLNSVQLVGRLTRDMEIRYTNNGVAIGNFALAVNRSVKRNDQWVDESNFFDVTVFGKTAENLKSYLVKGKQVAILGTLKQDRWEKDGQKFSKVGVVADSIQFVGGERKESSAPAERKGNVIAPNSYEQSYSSDDEFSEDVPF